MTYQAYDTLGEWFPEKEVILAGKFEKCQGHHSKNGVKSVGQTLT